MPVTVAPGSRAHNYPRGNPRPHRSALDAHEYHVAHVSSLACGFLPGSRTARGEIDGRAGVFGTPGAHTSRGSSPISLKWSPSTTLREALYRTFSGLAAGRAPDHPILPSSTRCFPRPSPTSACPATARGLAGNGTETPNRWIGCCGRWPGTPRSFSPRRASRGSAPAEIHGAGGYSWTRRRAGAGAGARWPCAETGTSCGDSVSVCARPERGRARFGRSVFPHAPRRNARAGCQVRGAGAGSSVTGK